jgi:hypothetical protein
LAIRTKLGEALRLQYDLAEPMPRGLLELLSQLDTGACVRDVTQERLYAEVEQGIAELLREAGRPPREPR